MPGFWDMQKRLSERRRSGGMPRAPVQKDASAAAASTKAQRPLTVTQFANRLNKVVKATLPAQFIVRGELSDWSTAASGHCYFCLKDSSNALQCVMWQSDALYLRFEPQDGQEVIATGFADTYAPKSQYQLKCHRLEPAGQGARDLAYRELIEKLDREGLFEPSRKRPLPEYPRRIAIVTSAQAAGFADVLKVFRGFGFLRLFHYPVPVQGEGAAQRIAEALGHIARGSEDIGGLDVVMLVRGGGAAEDLWAFEEESVARAVAGMPLPVITGIGHHTDRTIADMVADYEAHTPTEAARVLVRHWTAARQRIDQLGVILRRNARESLLHRRRELAQLQRHETFRRPLEHTNRQRRRVDELSFALARAMRQLARRTGEKFAAFSKALERAHPRQRLAIDRRRLDELSARLGQAMDQQSAGRRRILQGMARHLANLGPNAVLSRGYSLTYLRRTGGLLRAAADARPGDMLVTRTADGEVQSTVAEAKQGSLFA